MNREELADFFKRWAQMLEDLTYIQVASPFSRMCISILNEHKYIILQNEFVRIYFLRGLRIFFVTFAMYLVILRS